MSEKFKRFRPSEPPKPEHGDYKNPPPRKEREDDTGRIRTSRPAPRKSGTMEVVIPPETKKSKP